MEHVSWLLILQSFSGCNIADKVAVSLGEEPLVVDANIWPPPSVSCEAVEVTLRELTHLPQNFTRQEKLRSCLSSLPDSIQSWIAQIPNLPDLAGSAVKASLCSQAPDLPIYPEGPGSLWALREVSKSSLTMSIIRSDDDEDGMNAENISMFARILAQNLQT